MNQDHKKKIVIAGGGFGGLYVALELEKNLAKKQNVEVTLINRENFFLFTPMLHEVAASDLDITHIVNPIRKLLKRVKFFEGTIQAIDLESANVTVSHGSDEHKHKLDFTHLVIALGSITNFFNLPGLEETAFTMKSLGDAINLRNHLIYRLEESDPECCSLIRDQLLTFVVAGGGFAGVETIAGINDFLRDSVRFYPNLSEDNIRVILIHPGKVILPELGEKLGTYAQKKLAERKVEILVNSRVAGVTEDGVKLTDGTFIKAGTVIWTAGTSPNPILNTLACKNDKGHLVVDEYLKLPEWPNVWALGDCALVPDKKSGGYHPPTAQHALREARIVAKNIEASIMNRRMKEFKFSAIGQLAAIGKRSGVANILGINFSGFMAWWLWRTIYLSKLPRFEKKLRVMIDWTLDILFTKDLVQLNTERAPTVSNQHTEHTGITTDIPGTSNNDVEISGVKSKAQ